MRSTPSCRYAQRMFSDVCPNVQVGLRAWRSVGRSLSPSAARRCGVASMAECRCPRYRQNKPPAPSIALTSVLPQLNGSVHVVVVRAFCRLHDTQNSTAGYKRRAMGTAECRCPSLASRRPPCARRRRQSVSATPCPLVRRGFCRKGAGSVARSFVVAAN